MYENIERYWRAANYLTLAHIYLKKNVLQKRKLELSDVKTHYSGHWGTSPGINFIYAHLNHMIGKHKCKIQLVIGPGHAGSALLSNLFLEGSLEKWYPSIGDNESGMEQFVNIEHQICGMRSEINPFYPGTIYDGGELGYSYAVAMGAALNNEDLITVSVIGDGEAETGCLSATWKSLHCLGKKRGHILPIIHLNGYKMGSRSLLSYRTNEELSNMFSGMGYCVKIVEKSHKDMEEALDWAVSVFQKSEDIKYEHNPLIILRTPKGWTAPKSETIHIEGNVSSHKIPLHDIFENRDSFEYLERWLLSYHPEELFHADGSVMPGVKEIIPADKLKIGNAEYHRQELTYFDLKTEALEEVEHKYESINVLGDYLRKMLELNGDCFRIMSPDELTSNKLGSLLSFQDNIMEILNENICQGWMQGYNMTGRNSVMVSYEAFMPVVTSMVSQFTKCLTQMDKVSQRVYKPSLNYILTSTCWENTYSHQNPEFINSLIIQKNCYAKVYYPVDANTLLVCTDQSFKSRGKINVITISKHNMPQYFSLKEAEDVVKKGYYIFNKEVENPDIVLVATGDYCLLEMRKAEEMLRELFPNITYRLVSIVDLTKMCSWNKEESFDADTMKQIFMEDIPVVFLFHGYPLIMNAILADRFSGRNVSVMGYQNKSMSSTNVLGKMILNECSRFHILLKISESLYEKGGIGKERYKAIRVKIIKDMKEKEL